MRLHGVELLLQLHQPARSQVDIFQHHPPARLDGGVDVSVGLIEALSRTCVRRKDAISKNSLKGGQMDLVIALIQNSCVFRVPIQPSSVK